MKPNIIFYFSDQQRYDTLGCYGQRLPITPNLDQLAKEGVRFEYAFTPQPVCGPARSILQSSKFATRTKCYRNAIALPPEEAILAKTLKESGYYTGYVGKWHLATNEGDTVEDIGPHFNYAVRSIPKHLLGGYDYFYGADVLEYTSKGRGGGYAFDLDGNRYDWTTEYRSDHFNNKAIEFIDTHANQEQPFFLFVSQLEPHHQNDENRYEGPEGEAKKFTNIDIPDDIKDLAGDYNESYPEYLACIERLDQNVGQLVQSLKDNGIYDNTLLIYTSDHGNHFRTRNNEYKRSCHDASIRVPMIAKGEPFIGGKVVSNLVSLVDIPKTLMRAADASIPDNLDGHPIQETMTHPDTWKQDIFVQISEDSLSRAIRTKRYKYCITNPEYKPWNGAVTVMSSEVYYDKYLYDLETDPNEQKNLVHDKSYDKVKTGLRKQLIKRMVEAQEEEPTILDA